MSARYEHVEAEAFGDAYKAAGLHVRARERGAEFVVTETGERVEGRPSTSYRNILRAGFAEAHLQANLHSPE